MKAAAAAAQSRTVVVTQISTFIMVGVAERMEGS
jgi:hypothetical protein